MSQIIVGYDRQSVSTPLTLRRGDPATVRRNVYTYDPDTGQESLLNISAATEIVWAVTSGYQTSESAVLEKLLSASTIALHGNNAYNVTINASDTKGKKPGLYIVQVAIVLSSVKYKFQPYRLTLLPSQVLRE